MSGSLARLVLDRADAVAQGAVPGDVMDLALDATLDTLGVAVAGATEPVVRIAARGMRTVDGGGATLVGDGRQVDAEQAALINGAAIHALDYDDTSTAYGAQFPGPLHPTGPVLAAVLALGETTGADGATLLRALLVGVEVEYLLSELLTMSHYEAGWHATATCGTFGAALASAFLLRLDRVATEQVLGLASIGSVGMRSAFGSMGKPLQVGLAARNGLLAARWAADGMTGPSEPLDGPMGYFALHHGAAADQEPADQWRYPNVIFKYHAACFGLHSTIEVTRGLVAEHGILPTDVTDAELRVTEFSADQLSRPNALVGLESKFSHEANMARVLAGVDTSNPASYEEDAELAATLRPLAGLVRVVGDPTQERIGADVRLTLRDGRVVKASGHVDTPEPDPKVRRQNVIEKFQRLTQTELGEQRSAELAARVYELPEATTLAPLVSALAPDGSR